MMRGNRSVTTRCDRFRQFAAVAAVALLSGTFDSHAIPQFAWSTGMNCIDCHSVPPKLNARGEAFLARGYRLPGEPPRARQAAVPLSVWITGRYEDRPPSLSEFYAPKVELISGGPIGELPLSYFIEWRVVSLALRDDGTLQDRGGRFEDAFIAWGMTDRQSLRIGQFRSLEQYDVSLRLSVSEPAIFSASLPGDPAPRGRITSLRAFSPSGRSPGVAYTLQSLSGPSASDGLFHTVTVPFVGELSIPLSDEARREASFELQGRPKGVFLETFYRRRLNSIGAHAFIDRNRRLLTGVGRAHYKDLYATLGLGIDDASGRSSRMRYSAEVEYLVRRFERVRPGAGFRVEHITNAGRDPACIPYLVLSGPNTKFTFLLQVEGRFQGDSRAVFVDLSALF
jgi:hypothetical protein